MPSQNAHRQFRFGFERILEIGNRLAVFTHSLIGERQQQTDSGNPRIELQRLLESRRRLGQLSQILVDHAEPGLRLRARRIEREGFAKLLDCGLQVSPSLRVSALLQMRRHLSVPGLAAQQYSRKQQDPNSG